MSREKLTKKQQEVLDFIKSEIKKKGYPPSVRDICEAVHLRSTSSVHAHLSSLERYGYIRRDPAKPRAIEIEDDSFYEMRREMVQVPLVGAVAAGEPLLAAENIEGYFPIPAEYLHGGEMFMLKVRGESMINAGILDRDLILVEKTDHAKNGDCIVALVGDSATVKTYYKEDGFVRLQPENDAMEPIIVRDELLILGKVRGVMRFM